MPGKQFFRSLACACLVCSAAVSSVEPPSRLAVAVSNVADSSRPESERITAIRRLGESHYLAASPTLLGLLSHPQPDPIRIAAVQALGDLAQPADAGPMLSHWNVYSPLVKHQILVTMTARTTFAQTLLDHLERNALPLADVDAATRKRLAVFPDEAIVERARKVFAREPWLDAKAALNRVRPALTLKGDATRGRQFFKERGCVNCHRVGDEGYFVGADLFSASQMSREELLQNIVAPNLFFMPTFQAFIAETNDGELIEGVVAATTETTVTIRQGAGIDRVLNKSSLKRLKGLNVSLMPEGLLEGATSEQIADLLEFLKSLKGF